MKSNLKIAGLLTATLGLGLSANVWAQDGVSNAPRVRLNGQPFRTASAPYLQDGRVLVPLRDIFEGLGARVEFNRFDRTITARRSGTVVRMAIGSTQASVNKLPVTLDVPADTIAGRTFVPLRFVSEALGANVRYDFDRNLVSIQEGRRPAPGRDLDGDGVRNGRDHDRDGDGVRNGRDHDRDGDGIRDDRYPVTR